jgi:hypothetical protein
MTAPSLNQELCHIINHVGTLYRFVLAQFLGVFNVQWLIRKLIIIGFRNMFRLADRLSFRPSIRNWKSHGRCRRRITCIGSFLAQFLSVFDVQRLIRKLIIVGFRNMFHLADRPSFRSPIRGRKSMGDEEERYMLLVCSSPNFGALLMFSSSFES